MVAKLKQDTAQSEVRKVLEIHLDGEFSLVLGSVEREEKCDRINFEQKSMLATRRRKQYDEGNHK